ncbi:reverse transcriptase [Abeliophyllum distichum]|uniref:Reverse transcriptase n=1 Tax=Abeliophyllum distichum TaxID=126358 RepID=A0ABD1PCT0_9LAMI
MRLIDNVSATNAQLAALTKQVELLVRTQTQGVNSVQAAVMCENCGANHSTSDCMLLASPDEQVNFVQNNTRQQYNPYSQTYNPDRTPGTLPSNTVTNPKEQVQAITTRSGVQLPEIHVKRLEKKDTQILDDEGVEKQSVQPHKEDPKDSAESSRAQTQVPVKAYVPPIPFPQRLQKYKLDKQFANFLRKLELGEARPTTVLLQLADRSIKHPRGIIEDVLVKVNKFIFPADFIILDMEEDSNISIILGRPFLAIGRALIDVYEGKMILRVDNEQVIFNVFKAMKYPASSDSCFQVDVVDKLVADTFETEYPSDALAICMMCSESTKSEHPGESPQRPVPSIEKAPALELKPFPSHLRYAYLGTSSTLPVIIVSDMTDVEEEKLLRILKEHKTAIGWTIADIRGISPSLCMHKILMEENFKASVESQRRLNPTLKEVVRAEVMKLLDAGIIYPISDSSWVSPVHVVPKKGGITVEKNDNNELIPTRLVTGWRVCIDYRKLNNATRKDHFPLPFIDQMLERLAGHSHYCFLDGYSGYNQIPIAPEDQEKTTFTCPYGTFAFRRMPFGLCNAPATFQRCMMAIFSDMVEQYIEVFMDDF